FAAGALSCFDRGWHRRWQCKAIVQRKRRMVEPGRSATIRELDRGWCCWSVHAILADEAAEFRCFEKISCHVPYPWRSSGRLERRLVLSLESCSVGCAGMDSSDPESSRIFWVRSEVC